MKHVLEDFEGIIEGYMGKDLSQSDTFRVKLIDMDGVDSIAEVFKENIPLLEHKYIQPGAIFYLTIYNNGTIDFVFDKRTWTEEEIQTARKRAKELAKIFEPSND